MKSPTPSSNTDDTEDATEDTEGSSTSDENSNENNNLDTEKIKEIKKRIFMKKEKNDTSFVLQRTISGPLQNQLKHTKSMQSSLQQIPAASVIKSIQSTSGIVVVKQSSARLGRENIEESSSSTMEANNIERQSIVNTPSPCSITKIPHIKDFVVLPEIEFQRVVLSYLQSIEITYEQVLLKINALLRHTNSAGITLTKPEGLPKLPLSTMEQFEEMEKFLAVEENFCYYVSINKYIRSF